MPVLVMTKLGFAPDHYEAVEKAVKENGKIIRSSARRPESDIYSEITPTNSYDACLITVLHDGKPRKTAGRWNPTADDLMADDWTVITE